MEREIIKINNLNFKYRNQEEHAALRDINLNVYRGEFIVIMGHSGAGKSTLCFTLNGLIPNSVKGEFKGSVNIDGEATEKKQVSDFAETVGLVFQDFETQLFSTNVELEVAFGPENFAVAGEEIKKRVARALEIVDLEGFENREPSNLSGGQKQRLAIASVLSILPDVIVLDEPTTDLDPIGKRDIFNIARKLKKEDMTMVIAEHETEEALNADRILVMEEGRIIRSGPPGDILNRVEFLREKGIKPLQVAEFFGQYFNSPGDIPLTVKEGLKAWDKLNLKVNPDKYGELKEEDARKTESYGDVIVKARNLGHTYEGGIEALKNANFQIRKGEFVAVVGQNGSGKTTLVKHLNGLLMPAAGEVFIAGNSTRDQSLMELSRKVGYIFQNPDHQIFEETVYKEVAFGPRLQGQSEEELHKNVEEALKSVGLEGYEDEDPFSMSKGERQRIAVASILAVQPEIIIMDEPTTGLDYHQIESMMQLIKKLNEMGHTIIMVTHTMWVVAEYAHRALVLKDGEIMLNDDVRNVFSREDRLREAYLKPPQVVQLSNRLDNTVLTLGELNYITERGE